MFFNDSHDLECVACAYGELFGVKFLVIKVVIVSTFGESDEHSFKGLQFRLPDCF